MLDFSRLEGIIWDGREIKMDKPIQTLKDMPSPWTEDYKDFLWNQHIMIEGKTYIEAYKLANEMAGENGFILSVRDLDWMGGDELSRKYTPPLATSTFEISGHVMTQAFYSGLRSPPIVVRTHGLPLSINTTVEKRAQHFIDMLLVGLCQNKSFNVYREESNNTEMTARISVHVRKYDHNYSEHYSWPMRTRKNRLLNTLPDPLRIRPIFFWQGNAYMNEIDNNPARFLVIRGDE